MATAPIGPQLPQSWCELCTLADDDLAALDIAALNLAAAQGLPGMGAVDVSKCLERLDEWADLVKLEVLRQVYRFDPRSRQPPSEFSFGNSLGRFCCYILLQVLQEDCGVVYNPKRKFDPDFGDPADLFVHGILDRQGNGGTCATMPVVYVAVARRLGFPVRLVETREHLFFRWDDQRGTVIRWERPATEFWIPPDRFNVEGAGEGIAFYPDAHYIQWPHLWKEPDFAHGRYLRSLTSKEELATFLIDRGECFWEYRNWGECLKAYYYARQVAPDDPRYEWVHAKRTKEYELYLDHEREKLLEINERNRRAFAAIPNPPPSVGVVNGVVKVAYGTPLPADLPRGTPVRYVSADEADPTFPVGRPFRIAFGMPLPANLPPGTAVQYVSEEMADRIPPLPVRAPASVNLSQQLCSSSDMYRAQVERIRANNATLLRARSSSSHLRPQ